MDKLKQRKEERGREEKENWTTYQIFDILLENIRNRQLETANEKSFFYTIPIFSKLVKHVPFSRLDITNKYYDTNAM